MITLGNEINWYQFIKIDNNSSMSQATNQWFMDKGNSCDCRHDLTAIVDCYRLLYISGLVLYNHRFLFRKVNNLPQVYIKLNIETARYRAHLTSISENHHPWIQSTAVMITDWLSIIPCKSNYFFHSSVWYWLIDWLSIINFYWFLTLILTRWNSLHYVSRFHR